MQYVTQDIFRASALVLKTEKYPEHYYTTGENINGYPIMFMAWDDMPDKYVKQLEAGEMLVDPVSLKQVYRTLRTKLRNNKKDQNNENSAPTAATG